MPSIFIKICNFSDIKLIYKLTLFAVFCFDFQRFSRAAFVKLVVAVQARAINDHKYT